MKINGVEVVLTENQDGTFKTEFGPKVLGENSPNKKAAYAATLECTGVFGKKDDGPEDTSLRQK